MNDPVRLIEVLIASGIHMVLGLLVLVEAGDIGTMWITHARVAVRHPFGDELGDSGAFLDPYSRRRPQVADLRRLAEHRHRVRGERQQAVDRVLDFGVAEHVHQLDRLLHLRVEIVVRER